MKRMLPLLALVVSTAAPSALAAAPQQPVKDFVGHASYSSVKISPTASTWRSPSTRVTRTC